MSIILKPDVIKYIYIGGAERLPLQKAYGKHEIKILSLLFAHPVYIPYRFTEWAITTKTTTKTTTNNEYPVYQLFLAICIIFGNTVSMWFPWNLSGRHSGSVCESELYLRFKLASLISLRNLAFSKVCERDLQLQSRPHHSIKISSMSNLTDEQKPELLDRWYRLLPIDEGEEEIMCDFDVFRNEYANKRMHKMDRRSEILPKIWCIRAIQ